MTIAIRTAAPADRDIIAAANLALAQETEDKSLDPDIVRRGVQAVLDDAAHGMYYLAEVDGKVVGQLALTWEWSDWRNGTFWWIQSVYVTADCRGRGVFKALYNHVLDDARRRDGVCGVRLYVDKSNHSAAEVYRRLGMAATHYDMLEVDFTMA